MSGPGLPLLVVAVGGSLMGVAAFARLRANTMWLLLALGAALIVTGWGLAALLPTLP